MKKQLNAKLQYSKHDVKRIQKKLAHLQQDTSSSIKQAFVNALLRVLPQ